jgi:DNA excision repair protein ERCC-2
VVQLPYEARPGQAELIADIQRAQAEGLHLVVEAGTGTGKTIAVLSASLATVAKDHRRIVYATRTNSQQAQIVAEHAAVQATGQEAGLLVPFMGRRHYCPLLREDARFMDGTPEELGRLCRDAKRKAREAHDSGAAVQGACPYYQRLLRDGTDPVEALLRAGGLDATSLGARIESAGSCPYEALKLLMPKADAVAVPYVFLLDDRLRTTLLQWMGCGADECHLVVDEAHNLPDAARDHHSPRLSVGTLQRAQREAEEYKDPTLAGATLASSLLDALLKVIHDLADEYVRDGEDGLLPPDALTEALLMALRVPSPALQRIANDLERWGEIVREDRRTKGRLPRSHLGAVGAFLNAWHEGREAPYIQLVSTGDNPNLELYLLDPGAVLGWLQEFHSTVHMSGTLQPLEEHAVLCGLPKSSLIARVHKSPFEAQNLRIYGLEGVHRRFEAVHKDPSLVSKQQQAARDALQHLPGRAGLFFPSHEMLRDYMEEGFLHGVGRPTFVERPGMPAAELASLVSRFKNEPTGRGLLLAVLGGRLSEGIDFPGKAMESMLVFGIPYPRPSARSQALIHHYDRVTGNGWQVVVHNPTGRTLRQTIGRLIRGPTDTGTALVLDDRVVRFHAHLPGLRMVTDVRHTEPPTLSSTAGKNAQNAANRLQEKPSWAETER